MYPALESVPVATAHTAHLGAAERWDWRLCREHFPEGFPCEEAELCPEVNEDPLMVSAESGMHSGGL